MALPRAARTANSIPPFAFRPEVFNVTLTAPGRLAPGVLGLTILAVHDSRHFRFSLTSGPSRGASSDDVATALMNAIEQMLDREGRIAVVEEVVVLLRSGPLPISCAGITSKNFRPYLQQVLRKVVEPNHDPLLG